MNIWYIIISLLVVTIALAFWTAQRLILWARVPQNIAGAVMLIGMACTLLGYLYQLANNDLQLMLFWEKFQVIGLNLVYPAWLVFILFFTGNSKRVTWSLVIILGILSAFPMVIFILPATSEWFVHTKGVIAIGPLHVLDQEIGWAVWVSTVIAQIEGVVGTIFLMQQIRRTGAGYRTPILVLILSQIFAYLAIWLEISGANPIAPISIFNLSFIPTCIAVSWAIFKLRVGQSLELMREKVVETMHDSVIVLDSQHNIVYLNPSAQQMFDSSAIQSKNLPLAHLLPELAGHLLDPLIPNHEDDVVTSGELIYSIRRSVIDDWKGDMVGQALVLRNITDRERMEKTIQARAVELARLNAFTQALSLLAAKVAGSDDIDQVYHILRDELHRQGLEFCVGLRTPGEPGYVIEYLSLDHPIIQFLERFLGRKTIGFRFPELSSVEGVGGFEENGVIYFPNLIDSLPLAFGSFPKNFDQIFMANTGFSLQVATLTFRLIAQDDEIGTLSVWGPALRREDLSPLSTFAAQVSAAIQKTRLIRNEKMRVTELERMNSFILSLTQVAARFEANLTVDQIMESLGVELKKLNVTFVIAFLDPDTDELVGRYTSATPSIWKTAEKVTGVTLDAFRIPFKEWQAMDPDSTGPARIVSDPVNLSHRIIRKVPKIILKRGIQMVGISPQKPAVWLPLRASDRNMGILVLWGIQEPQHYLTVFSLFAQQVATAIEKARLMADMETLKSFNEGIVQGVAEAIMMFSPDGKILFANPSAGKMFGVPSGNLVGKDWSIFIPPAERDYVEKWLSGPVAKNAVGVEFNLLHQEGHLIPVLINIKTIYKDDQPGDILVSLMDIQERIQAEQQIRTSMDEKEALLKEIHHRVKNNLQIVSSLLNLQANNFSDPLMIDAFRESQNRVRSMALIHEKLYRSNNLARIRFDEYIKELTVFLMRSYTDASRHIQLDIQADPVNLDIDTAIPCGLIINELVTNSLKHGFPIKEDEPSGSNGHIFIRMALLPEHQIQLCIEDNGVGFPINLDASKIDTLGLQLVTSLTRQLGGEVHFRTNLGAKTEINFTSASASGN